MPVFFTDGVKSEVSRSEIREVSRAGRIAFSVGELGEKAVLSLAGNK